MSPMHGYVFYRHLKQQYLLNFSFRTDKVTREDKSSVHLTCDQQEKYRKCKISMNTNFTSQIITNELYELSHELGNLKRNY